MSPESFDPEILTVTIKYFKKILWYNFVSLYFDWRKFRLTIKFVPLLCKMTNTGKDLKRISVFATSKNIGVFTWFQCTQSAMAYSALPYISLFNFSLLHLSISYGLVANCFPKCDFPVDISTACFQMTHLDCNLSLELTSVFFHVWNIRDYSIVTNS